MHQRNQPVDKLERRALNLVPRLPLIIQHQHRIGVDKPDHIQQQVPIPRHLLGPFLELGLRILPFQRQRLDHSQRRVRNVPLGDLIQRIGEHGAQLGRFAINEIDLRPPVEPRLRDYLVQGADEHEVVRRRVREVQAHLQRLVVVRLYPEARHEAIDHQIDVLVRVVSTAAERFRRVEQQRFQIVYNALDQREGDVVRIVYVDVRRRFAQLHAGDGRGLGDLLARVAVRDDAALYRIDERFLLAVPGRARRAAVGVDDLLEHLRAEHQEQHLQRPDGRAALLVVGEAVEYVEEIFTAFRQLVVRLLLQLGEFLKAEI